MCNIWKIPSDVGDLPLSDWIRLLSEPVVKNLRELDITGGEPFLRNDLPVLLNEIARMKPLRFPRLRSVAVTTNGFLTEKILETVHQALPLLREAGIGLVLALAMDGVGKVHDGIRNVKGGWARLDRTIRCLTEIREADTNLVIGLKTTILPDNVTELYHIAEYARVHNLFTIISPCIITSNRYANLDLQGRLRFSPKDLEIMAGFYESPHFKWDCHRDMLRGFLRKGTTVKPCSAGFNYFFIRSSGEIFPCPLIDWSVGNMARVSLEEAIQTTAAKRFRQKVGRFDACSACTEPGIERYSLPFEGFHYLRSYFRLGRNDFLRVHRHMGLDKYM